MNRKNLIFNAGAAGTRFAALPYIHPIRDTVKEGMHGLFAQ
jgi:hypothetical protein